MLETEGTLPRSQEVYSISPSRMNEYLISIFLRLAGKKKMSNDDISAILTTLRESVPTLIRDLEGNNNRGFKEFREKDIVKIKSSPYFRSLSGAMGTIMEVMSYDIIMVGSIRGKYIYRPGKLAFNNDQLELLSGTNE